MHEINEYTRGHEVDFDLKKVYDMPGIEQLIFFYVNFDKCRKEIIQYETKRQTNADGLKKHPKESKKEALSLLKCHSNKYSHQVKA